LKFGLRARLFVISAGVLLVAVVVVNHYAKPELEARLMAEARSNLAVETRLIAAAAEAHRVPQSDAAALEALTKRLGKESGSLVQLLDGDGTILASSDGQTDPLGRANDPAFKAAGPLRSGGGGGEFVVEGRRLFAAAKLRLGDGSDAVARVGVPLSKVDSALAEFREMLLAGTILLLALSLIVSSLVAQLTARGLGSLTDVARRMAAGDLEARSGLDGDDELAELGRTLDKLARGLSTSLKELRGERDRMAGILEGMQEGVLLLDANRRIVVLNPALREMLLLPNDVVGKPLLDVVRHAELKDLFDTAAADDEPTVQEVEIGNIKPRRLLCRVARMPGEQKQVVAVFVDVTEMRRLESMRRDFVANVSHELRTPVTAIRSAAETLIDGAAADPAAAQAFVGIIDRNAQRLHALVEDLLDLSRIEARGFRLSFEAIELRPIFSQVIGLFRERASKKSVTLAERPLDGLPRVRADRRALEHVLTNLIDNAVKYCGPGAHVWLGVKTSGDNVTVSVSDDGPGIDERHLPRIFERFYRVDAGRSRDVGGTGLGLSIVKHLVEAMGGSVHVESKLNSGTTFSFTLRRAESEQEEARAVA
jgi:two-component system phosphate regulon sensor histidine kinase PhoR